MAKRCKHRSNFKMSEKCETCGNRRRCRRKIRANKRKAVKKITVILALVIIGAIAICIKTIRGDAQSATTKVEVDCQPVQIVASKAEVTEVKTVSQVPKNVQTTSQSIQPVAVVVEEQAEQFSESEKIAMGKTVYKEARGECEKGRIAIVAVILNRLETRSAEYGAENGNVMEVITYPSAFAYPKDMTDEFFLNCPEYEICMAAVEAAINGEDPTEVHFPEGARHFYSLTEPLSEAAQASREGIDIYVIGNQAFHNDMN